jgi:glyoxylase-like metal-dependent hydrolase (beta-lactamase superfamily II)
VARRYALPRNAALRVAVLATFILPASGRDYAARLTVQKVADGVYLFISSRHGDVGFVGNSVAILSDEGVLVFDAGCVPSDSATVLTEIRQFTDKPVRYLVNSHWHWDHWQGNQTYKVALPGLQIVSQENTRVLMREVSVPRTQNDLKDLPPYIASLEKDLAAKRAAHATEVELRDLEQLLQADKYFLAQKQTVQFTYPNFTFAESATIWLGTREIRLFHAQAITSGDTYAYLPKEKLLITGDILVRPIPFAVGGTFPADWIATLQRLIALNPEVVIPGHGATEGAKQALEQNLQLFQRVVQQVRDAKAKSLSEDQTVEAIGKNDKELAAIIGVTDASLLPAFKPFFLEVFVRRAYQELDHPLTDFPSTKQ